MRPQNEKSPSLKQKHTKKGPKDPIIRIGFRGFRGLRFRDLGFRVLGFRVASSGSKGPKDPVIRIGFL